MTETFDRVDGAGISWRVTIDRVSGVIVEDRLTPLPARSWNGRSPETRKVSSLTALQPAHLDVDGLAILSALTTRRPPNADAAMIIAIGLPGSGVQRVAAVETYIKHYT